MSVELDTRAKVLLAAYMTLSLAVWVMTVVMLVGRVDCSGLGQMWIIVCFMIAFNVWIFCTRAVLLYNTFVKEEIKWRTLFISTEVAQIIFFASIPLTIMRLDDDAECWYRNATYGDDVPKVLGWVCVAFAVVNLVLTHLFFSPPRYPSAPAEAAPAENAETTEPV